MRTLTAAQMRQAEAAAVARGTSYEQLMENAGTRAARAIEDIAAELQLAKNILLLCGRGNNAGDAFVVARLLAARGWQVKVLLLCGRELSQLAALNFGRLPDSVAVTQEIDARDFSATVLCDGVFGTGFHGDLPEHITLVCRFANLSPGCRVALDVPTGLDCDTGEAATGTFQADYTLTFGAYKPGLLRPGGIKTAGRVQCLDIGL